MAYRRIFSTPHVLQLTIASVVARLPVGMTGVAFVIYVHDRTGSFGAAGAVAGAGTIGLALTAPVLGRLVDRRGPRPVLVPAAAVAAAALTATVVVGDSGGGTVALVLLAGLAGAAMPPVGGLLRHLWPDLVEEELLVNAYVLDSMLIEAVFVTGPLLTGLLAATAGPAAALLVAGGLGLIGTVWFVALPPLGRVEPAPPHHRTRAGALASPTIRLLVFTGIPVGSTFGALDVALPAFGAAHGSPALGGPFTAALAFGSALGALAYGAAPERFGTPAQVSVRLAIFQPLICLPLLLAPSIGLMLALGVLAGSFIAPTITARTQLARVAMPPGTGTEVFTWLSLSIMIGASAGSAVAGPVVEAGGWRAGVVLAAVLPALGLPFLLARRGLLLAQPPAVVEAQPRPHQAVVDEAGLG
ncbi:MAG TPA: MFS transporter [Solirubrobacterales bacterium]|nr:MFS transporter [Solirubrobacterales bacterium]